MVMEMEIRASKYTMSLILLQRRLWFKPLGIVSWFPACFVFFESTVSFFLSDRPPPPVQVGVIVVPPQMSHLNPFHNHISISTSSFHDNPNVHYTRTYSSMILPMESDDGVIDDNHRLSYNQTRRCCRTTFQSNAISILGSNNVITFTHTQDRERQFTHCDGWEAL